jgi:hypothetical protein
VQPGTIHADGRAVTPGGIGTNRIVVAGSATGSRTAHNTRDARRAGRHFFENLPLGAGPRAGGPAQRWTAATLADVPADVADYAGFARGDALDLWDCFASAGWHTTAANAVLLADRQRCNSTPAAGTVETSAHTLSTGNVGTHNADQDGNLPRLVLDHCRRNRNIEVGPREAFDFPTVKPRGEAANFSPRRFSTARQIHLPFFTRVCQSGLNATPCAQRTPPLTPPLQTDHSDHSASANLPRPGDQSGSGFCGA